MDMTAELYSVTQAAKVMGVSHNTIRHWTGEFGEYLSDYANVPKSETRYYTPDDMKVFGTVAVLRQQKKPFTVIHEALGKEERYALPETEQPTEPPQQATSEGETEDIPQDRALASLDALEQFVKPFQDRIEALENRLDGERDARLEAEIRAAAAEALVYRRHGWQFWKPKRPEDDD